MCPEGRSEPSTSSSDSEGVRELGFEVVIVSALRFGTRHGSSRICSRRSPAKGEYSFSASSAVLRPSLWL